MSNSHTQKELDIVIRNLIPDQEYYLGYELKLKDTCENRSITTIKTEKSKL